ncbi:hypothetical protein NQD34_007555 [Periophthalmus magnuspinnatus]|nr:hypothetical protein NQD34_007555 [Periophthalmus magnuspinnatus]
MAVQLALSVLLIASLTVDIFGVPFGYKPYEPYAPGSGSQEALQQPPAPAPGPVRPDVHNVFRLPQFQMQDQPVLAAGEAAPEAAAGDTADYMPPAPLNGPQDMSPWKPDYQAGELYKFDRSHDYGHNQRESNMWPLFLPPPIGGPVPIPIDPYPMAGPTDDQLPYVGAPNNWPIPLPPPMDFPFDYAFLMGQYPQGTYSYQTRSFEDGSNYNNDVHYTNYPDRQWVRPFGVVF